VLAEQPTEHYLAPNVPPANGKNAKMYASIVNEYSVAALDVRGKARVVGGNQSRPAADAARCDCNSLAIVQLNGLAQLVRAGADLGAREVL